MIWASREHASLPPPTLVVTSAPLEPVRPAFHGKTPIAKNLVLALEDFEGADRQDSNSVILLTDGVESCGGNVDRAIDEIMASGIRLKVHIVGFDVLDVGDTTTSEELSRMAERTGGKAEFPKTQAELEQSLKTLAPQPEPPPPAEPSAMDRALGILQSNLVVLVVGGVALISLGVFLLLRERSEA